jgi:hypothetical protein
MVVKEIITIYLVRFQVLAASSMKVSSEMSRNVILRLTRA